MHSSVIFGVMMIISISLYSFDGSFIDFCIPKNIHKRYVQKKLFTHFGFQKSNFILVSNYTFELMYVGVD